MPQASTSGIGGMVRRLLAVPPTTGGTESYGGHLFAGAKRGERALMGRSAARVASMRLPAELPNVTNRPSSHSLSPGADVRSIQKRTFNARVQARRRDSADVTWNPLLGTQPSQRSRGVRVVTMPSARVVNSEIKSSKGLPSAIPGSLTATLNRSCCFGFGFSSGAPM